MTELIWDGKYKDGKKVAPVRIQLPFQTVGPAKASGKRISCVRCQVVYLEGPYFSTNSEMPIS